MAAPPKEKAAPTESRAAEGGSIGGGTGSKPNRGRPELQVNGNGRRADQPAPIWPDPPGADAARDLGALLRRWSR